MQKLIEDTKTTISFSDKQLNDVKLLEGNQCKQEADALGFTDKVKYININSSQCKIEYFSDDNQHELKLEIIEEALIKIVEQGYNLPPINVFLANQNNPSVRNIAYMTDFEGNREYNLFLSGTKFLTHSGMIKNSNQRVKGGLRDKSYSDGQLTKLQVGDHEIECLRVTPLNSGFRGVADQVGDKAKSKFSRKNSLEAKQAGSYAFAVAVVIHEIGHILHENSNPSEFWSQKVNNLPTNPEFSNRVSEYASINTLEYVAETFTGKVTGQKYSSPISNFYEILGGPSPAEEM